MKTVLLLLSLLQAIPLIRMEYEKLPDMPTPRCAPVVTSSGESIFAFGGHTSGFIPVATAACFSGGKWQTLDMIYPHDGGFLTVLPDGKWMLGGGSEKPFGIGQTFGVELFDPATHRFSPLTIMDRPRAYASAAALPGGRIIVSGNWYKEDGIELYTPKEGFKGIKNTVEARRSPYILPLKDGNALIFGGMDSYGDTARGWVDQLEGEPFFVPLLAEWSPFNFYVSFSPPAQIAPETWLVPAISRTDGSAGILLVQGKTFSLLPTDVPIPRTGISACDIEYAMPLLLDTRRECAWLPGIDTGKRFYLVKLDYAPALKEGRARVTTYYAENPDIGFPKEMGFVICPDGSIAALGGFLTDNFLPVSTAFLFRPLGPAASAGLSRALVPALIAAGLLAAAGAALFLSRRRKKAAAAAQSSPSEQLMQRIRTILEEKQLYKVHGLQVADLAKELGSNTTYVSACINKETGASFNDLVNGYRIHYALGLLTENPSLSVVHVADISGFSSYSSFLRSFRQYTGKTPSEYLSAGQD